MNESPSHRNIYFTSFLWAVPVCFVGTIVTTVIVLLIAAATSTSLTGGDVAPAALAGVFLGVLIFAPSCLITVPIVGLTAASYRLFAADRRRRREGSTS